MNNEPFMRHEDVLKKVRLITVIISSLFTVLGILLIMFPNEMQTIMGFVIGIGAIAIGIYRIYVYLRRQRSATILATDLFLGVVCCIAGIVFIARHNDIPRYVLFVYGVFLVAGCIVKLQNAIDLYHVGMYRWWIVLILAVVSCVLAGIVLLRPGLISGAYTIVAGLFLLYDGLSGFAAVFLGEITFRKIRKGLPIGKPAPKPVPPAGAPVPPVTPQYSPEQARVITDDDPFDPSVIQAAHSVSEETGTAQGAAPTDKPMNFDPDTGERIN